ncbi:MAG: hypothetical protein WKH64_03075 [Chloroflexia bacterium]
MGIIFADVGSTTINDRSRGCRGAAHPRGGHQPHCAACGELRRGFRGAQRARRRDTFGAEQLSRRVRIAFFRDPDGNVLELVEELNAERTS